MSTIYDFTAKNIDGELIRLEQFKGKYVLIVNVASKCGFTSQYKELEDLYQKYKNKNLVVIGFPCNQFGGQEPGTEQEIKQFCELTYKVTFPMFSKIEVNGDNAHPLYKYLKSAKPGVLGTEAIKWNFTKFLINDKGEPVHRFAPNDTGKDIETVVDKYIK